MPEIVALPPETLEPSVQGALMGQEGLKLAFCRWEHPSPVGRIAISHGFGEHGLRYSHTARWLHDLGWSVSALDHRGFGRSEGARGDANGIQGFVEDWTAFLRQERLYDAGRQPLLVLAHSFGGLVALLTALWHPDAQDGLILSSPAVVLRSFSRPLRWANRLLAWLAPHRQVSLGGVKTDVCSDPILVQRYWADPLCHRTITAAYIAAMEEGAKELLPMGAELECPMLVLDAERDTVVEASAATPLWDAVRPALLERHRLAGFRHEIFHDLRRAEAQQLSAAWLSRFLAQRAASSRTPMTPAGNPVSTPDTQLEPI
jgi:alpha-beta hydrolase superfamily lysophospholipase